MLDLVFGRSRKNCEGTSRRNFLRVGGLGLSSVSLGNLLQQKARAAEQGIRTSDKSVIWLWLSGGPTHVETFDPKMTAPAARAMATDDASTEERLFL